MPDEVSVEELVVGMPAETSATADMTLEATAAAPMVPTMHRADAEAADKEFHKEVEIRLEEALGYKLFVVDKPWDTAEALDEGEGL